MAAYASGYPQAGTDDYSDSSAGNNLMPDARSADQGGDGDDQEQTNVLKETAKQDKDVPLLPGLTPDLEAKIIALILDFEQESFPIWRWLNRDFFEAESFWKDLQYGFWDAKLDVWRAPTTKELTQTGDGGQRFTFQTNIYRAFGSAIINSLGQKIPTTRFLPANFMRDLDVTNASVAQDLVPIIERWNKFPLLNVRAAYLLYTHGIVGGYTRYLEDAEKFGWREIPEVGYQQAVLQEEGYECTYCSGFTAASAISALSSQSQPPAPGSTAPPAGPGAPSSSLLPSSPTPPSSTPPLSPPEASGIACPTCGYPMGELNYRPPEYGDMPVEMGTKLVPRGRQVVTLHGGLELRLPPWCNEMADYPYLGLVHETHISALKATYGDRAKGLQGGWGAGPYDSWDRFARLALIEPTVSYYGTSNQNLVTFKRYWLRPSAYFQMKSDDDVQTMLKMAPDGLYVAFADTKRLLDARNERMDDHWEIGTAVEGAGAYTPAMGSSTISIQKRYNTIENFIMEWVEYGAAGAGTFFNANVINYKAMRTQRRAPGMFYPLRMPINANIQNVLKEGTPGQISGQIFQYGQSLLETGRLLSGAEPTVTGGTQQSLKPTTFISDKESALGRLFTAWLHMRWFWAGLVVKSVRDFGRWAQYDELYSIFGPDGDAQGKIVRVQDLRGDIDAYPETNEQFPVLWQQMQQTFMELMQIAPQNPEVNAVMVDLENVPFAKTMLGLPDLFVPGMDDRMKQKKEINLLLQSAPLNVPQLDPQTGQLTMTQQPSIPIDPFEDNSLIHENQVKKWAVSAEGLRAKLENPQGYRNVILHGLAHENYRLGLQAQAAAIGMPASGGDEGDDQGGGGGGGGMGSAPAGPAGGKGGAGGKAPAKKGASDNPADSGGASPLTQTSGIKNQMTRSLAGGTPNASPSPSSL